MAKEREYIVKTEEGEEYGPVDQECLVRWAENGRITSYCQVRSTLLHRWERAIDVPFLRDLLLTQSNEDAKPGIVDRVRRRATMRAAANDGAPGLKTSRAEDFETAPVPLRFLAAVLDVLVVGAMLILIFLFFSLFFYLDLVGEGSIVSPTTVFYIAYIIAYLSVVAYFACMMTFWGQTVGQKFWGVFLLHTEGKRFYLGRIYLYSFLTVFTGVFTPFFTYVMPSKRSLQEILTNTRMVKVKLVGNKKMRAGR